MTRKTIKCSSASIENEKHEELQVNQQSYCDDTRSTLLHIAAVIGNDVIVQELLSKGVDINAQDKHGRTAIMLAVKNENHNTVAIILKSNPDLQLENESKKNALNLMLEGTNHPVNIANILSVLRLGENNEKIETSSIKWNYYNSKAIYNVIDFNNAELLRFFIKNGYPIDCKMFGMKSTPLHAAFKTNKLEIAKVLLEYDADVDIKCISGKIPLTYYDKFDDSDLELEVLKIVFDRVTTLTTQHSSGNMQITQLLIYGRKRVIEALLRSNAVDWTAKDHSNKTPLHYLATNRNLSKEQHIFKLLHDKELDVDVVDKDGESLLFKAAMNVMPGLLQFLFDRNVIVRDSDKFRLLIAVYNRIFGNKEHAKNYYRCAELLLHHVVDPQVEFYVSKCKWCFLGSLYSTGCGDCFDVDWWSGNVYRERTLDTLGRQRTLLDMTWVCRDLARTKLILAHLAIIEARGSSIIDSIQTQINSHPWLSNQFNLCRLHLNRFKRTKVSEDITLFDLMRADEEKLVLYLRNQEFFARLKRIDVDLISKSIYSKIFWDRLRIPLREVEAKRNAGSIICEVSGLSCQAHYIIIDKIIKYFWSRQALRNFLKVK